MAIGGVMSHTRSTATMLAALCMIAQVLSAQVRGPSLVDVGGHKLNVQVAGTSKPGLPTDPSVAGGLKL